MILFKFKHKVQNGNHETNASEKQKAILKVLKDFILQHTIGLTLFIDKKTHTSHPVLLKMGKNIN